ncbi:MAG: hypothetical protein HC854_07635 [Flavobacterium sp.]|nr:hypothetical protein [Flavobacterium sp.]
MKKLYYLVLLLLSLKALSQNVESTKALMKKSYDELINEYFNNLDNKPNADKIISAYLKKAKIDNNTVKIAYGYFNISYYNPNAIKSMVYMDSMFAYSKKINHSGFPAMGFVYKARIYSANGLINKCLDEIFDCI